MITYKCNNLFLNRDRRLNDKSEGLHRCFVGEVGLNRIDFHKDRYYPKSLGITGLRMNCNNSCIRLFFKAYGGENGRFKY